MLSRLSDRIAQAMEANTSDGRCDTEGAAADLIAMFGPEDTARAQAELASRLIGSAARKAFGEIGAASAAQGELPFRLHRAYALDLDGRQVVNTFDLTQREANRALEIRDRQIAADTASRNDLARAIKAAEPFWTVEHGLSFGRALERAAAEAAA